MAATDASPAPPRRRLNPFSFPSDTTFRFALLVLAVVASSLDIYNLAYYRLAPHSETAAQLACQEPLRQAVALGGELGTPEVDAIAQQVNDCTAPYSRRIEGVVIGGAAVLLLLATLLYLITPSWLIRRRRLVPLSDDDAPGVLARFGQLLAEAGVDHRTTLLWNPMAPGGSALAFGRPGRSYVAVGPALVTQFYKNRPVFDAVVRHELAHLANRDVSKAYLAVSIWRAFVVAALVPFALMLADQRGRDIWDAAWHVAALAVIVYLTRNGVLRAREYYADVRASQWDANSALPTVLNSLPAGTSPWWRRWVSVHPSPRQRLNVLNDTRALFQLGVWDAVGAGVMAGLALPILRHQLHVLINAFGTPVSYENAPTGAALIVASLLGTVLGVGIWRAAFGARLAGERTPKTAWIVVGLASGFILGDSLSLGGSGLQWPRASFALAVLAVMALLVCWLVATADACLDAIPAARSPRLFYCVGLFAAGLSAWAIGKVWVFDSSLIGGGARWLHGWSVFISQEPVTLVMATAVCVVPLAALTFGRRHQSTTPAWAWLEAPADDAPWPGGQRPRLARVLGWGLVAAAAYVAVVLVFQVTGAKRSSLMGSVGNYFYADLLSEFSGEERSAAAWKLGWGEFQRFFALALVGVAAAGAALRATRFPVLHALFAGCVAAVVMVPAFLILNAAFGGTSDLDFTWLWTKTILGPAVFVALAAGIAGEGVRQLASRRPRTPVPRPSEEWVAA